MTDQPYPVRVLLASPTAGSVTNAYKQSVHRLMACTNPEGIYVYPQDCEGSNIAENQNALAWQADRGIWHEGVMVAAPFDYLLLVETDIGFPAHGLWRLLSHGKDIVGCSTPWKERGILASALNGDEPALRYMGHEIDNTEITLASLEQGEPLRRVNFLPMGFVLISTKALRAISDYRRQVLMSDALRERAKDKWVCVFSHKEYYPEDSERGVIGTTDSAFCSDARDAGLDVWLDAALSLTIEHVGTCNYVAPERSRRLRTAQP